MGINMADTKEGVSKTGSQNLEDWKSAIRLALRYRRVYGRSNEWQKYKNYYRGFFKGNQIPVNIIFAIGRSIIPQVYFRNPRVSILPRKPGYAMHARILERLDNYLIDEMNIKESMKSEVLDTYLTGRGMGILGYDSEYGFSQSFLAPDIHGDVTLTSFAPKGQRIEYNYNISPGMPWYQRCNPLDFIVPWGTHRFEEAPWFAFRKMRPLRDIMEDPKYKNKKDLKAPYKSKIENSDQDTPNFRLTEDYMEEFVELWQIHDQRTGQVKVLSLDHDKWLREDQDYLQIEGLPARVIGFNEDPEYFWWPSDCRQIIKQQEEINDIRTMAQMHRRVALLKVLYDKGAFKKEYLEKLFDGDPKVAVGIDVGPQGDIRKSTALFQSHVPPDLALAAREVREDVREIIGFSRNQMGSFEESSGRRTAHEAEVVRAASMIRIDERRDILADHLGSIVRGVNQIIFENWSSERVIDIIGNDGARYWVRFTGKDIRSEVTEKINPEETIPSDKRTQTQEIQNFIAMATKIPGMDVKYLLEQYADKYEWLDAKMLFPSNAPGRSPEKAMQFADFMRMGPQGTSSFPQLGNSE
jgi:hypothetical protein